MDVTKLNASSHLYPKYLKEIKNAPKEIYVKGNLDGINFDRCLGVVGSRKITPYGKRVVDTIISQLLNSGITVVSGFMIGVDAYSHSTALKYGLKTIAVMPCGIDYIHPEDQEDLYNSILYSGGLIISEFEADFKPRVWTYPKRNRIVAGLCQAVLIVEAAQKSGSLITANFANEFNRRVFAVPGGIFSENSLGIFDIINKYAECVYSAEPILKFFNLHQKSILPSLSEGFKNKVLPGSEKSKDILELLDREAHTVDDLANFTGRTVSDLSCELTNLLLQGVIFEEEGKFYVC